LTPEQRQALRDAQMRDAVRRLDLQAERDRLAARVAQAERHRQRRSTTIPAGQSAYVVDVSETPFPNRRSDDNADRLAEAQTRREIARITQISGADLTPTEGSQRRAVAEYLASSRNLRPIVVRDKIGRLTTTGVSDDRPNWAEVANGDED
jgi:hypothetical protein